jgi:hypothetical protein
VEGHRPSLAGFRRRQVVLENRRQFGRTGRALFFYGLYYDLVADTDEERARVRERVAAIVDHLIEHNF